MKQKQAEKKPEKQAKKQVKEQPGKGREQRPDTQQESWEDPFSYSFGEPMEDEEPVPPFSAFTLQDHDPLTVPYPDEPETAEVSEELAKEPVRESPISLLRKARGKASPIWKALFPLSVLLLFGLLLSVFSYRAPWMAFRSGADALQSSRFFSGLKVDGTDVGGMTYSQAENVLAGMSKAVPDEVKLTIRVGGTEALFTSADISYSRSVTDALDQAYAAGRSWDSAALEEGSSPFEERHRAVRALQQSGLSLSSSASYHREDVEAFAARLAAQVDTPAVSARLKDVDFVRRTFSYTDDQSGLTLDQEDLVRQICSALDEGQTEGTIQAHMTRAAPAVLKTDLMNRFGLMNVRSVATATKEGDRALKAVVQALNGVVVQDGDRFSFWAVLEKAGYTPRAFEEDPLPTQLASAVMDGGLCAGLTLETRCSLPQKSNLIPPGTEAVIAEGQDMVLVNASGTPACILCYYTPRTSAGTAGDVTIEWYGLTLNAGEEVRLEAEKTGETKPGEPIYRPNNTLPAGRRFLIQEQAAGEDWTCFLVYTHSGREYRRETVFTTSYPARERIIEYNEEGAQP